MNALFQSALLAAAAITAPAFAASDAVIEFANDSRDSLPGSLVAIRGSELIWKSPLLTQPDTPFLIGKVLSLTQAPATAETPPGDYEAVVTLTNGDTLRGKLSLIGDSQITLATAYAGDLKLRRTMIRNLVIDNHPQLVFSGPSGMEGWKETAGTRIWTYKNNAFESSGRGGLFRDIAMPDKASLSFDLAWRDSLSFRFTIFCNDPNSRGFAGNGYEVECQRRYTIIRKRRSEGMIREEIIGQPIHIPGIAENEKARFEIRGDREKGRFQLLVDGIPVGDWEDSQPEPAKMGGGILFCSEDMSGVRLSRIRVAAWDGTIKPVGTDEEGHPKEAEKDKQDNGKPKMILRNGDVLVGDVLSIDHDIMKVRTGFGEVMLPVSRAESFSLTNAGHEEPILKNGDIRAWFSEGGSVTFRLDEFSDGKLRGFSQTFGEAAFRLNAFTRLEFNLYNPEFEGLRDERHDS